MPYLIEAAVAAPEAALPSMAVWTPVGEVGQLPLTYLMTHFEPAAEAIGAKTALINRGIRLLGRQSSDLQPQPPVYYRPRKHRKQAGQGEFLREYVLPPDYLAPAPQTRSGVALRADRLSELFRVLVEERQYHAIHNWGTQLNGLIGGLAIVSFRQGLIEPSDMEKSKILWRHAEPFAE